MSEEYENEPMADVTNDSGADAGAGEPFATKAPAAAVVGTQLYVKSVPRDFTEDEFRGPFEQFGPILSAKLLQGYGFIEYESKDDAQKSIDELHGTRLYADEPIIIEFSRSKREPIDENAPRFRALVENISGGTSWQDLKDFARDGGFEVPFSVIDHDREATGILEFTSQDDLDRAITELSGKELNGSAVTLSVDTRPPPPRRSRGGRGGRGGFGGRGGGRGFGGGRGRGGYDRRDSFGRGGRGGGRGGSGYRDYDRYDRRDDRGRDDYRDRRGGGFERRDDYRRGGDFERRDDFRERRYRSRSPRRDGGRSPPPPPPGGEPSW